MNKHEAEELRQLISRLLQQLEYCEAQEYLRPVKFRNPELTDVIQRAREVVRGV